MDECENKKYHDELKIRVRQLEAQLSEEKLKAQTELIAQEHRLGTKIDKLEAEIEKLKKQNEILKNSSEKVIKFNLTEALHKYGDSQKAENWACVVTLREALKQFDEVGEK